MTDEVRLFRLFGTKNKPAEARILTSGPLKVGLEDGNLRTISYGQHEVLRAIAFLVRDRDWGTCAAQLEGLRVEETISGFIIRYRATYSAPDGAQLVADLKIEAEPSEIRFSARAQARGDFKTARAGFTVLHPIKGVAGQPVIIEHADGSVENAHWPVAIEPWQPFKDIAAITHNVADGIKAETRFSGDVFEMEDQRNWTDGSYKTYVRPLALPWPYRIADGERFEQSVTLKIIATQVNVGIAEVREPLTMSVAASTTYLPKIGLGLRPDCMDEERDHTRFIKQVGAKHLIGHFDPLAGHGLRELRHFADLQILSSVPFTLEFAVPCRRPLDVEFFEIAECVRESGLVLSSLFVSPSVDRQSTPPGSTWPECPPLEDVYGSAAKAFPGLRIGGGMMSYFTELNRKRVPAENLDYISHCTNPIVHAAGDLSVMQTFESLDDVVRSVRSIYPDKTYRIGPSTIAMRQNPYGSATKDNPRFERIAMANVDPRHNGQFGAAWTLAYAATVAQAGLDLLTLSTLAGPFGLIAGDNEPCADGTLRPLGHVIGLLASYAGCPALTVDISDPASVRGFGAVVDSKQHVLFANITSEKVTIRLDKEPEQVSVLDENSIGGGFEEREAGRDLTLDAYACVRVICPSSALRAPSPR